MATVMESRNNYGHTPSGWNKLSDCQKMQLEKILLPLKGMD